MKKLLGGALKAVGAVFILLVVIALAFGGSGDKESSKGTSDSSSAQAEAAATDDGEAGEAAEEPAEEQEAPAEEPAPEDNGPKIAEDSEYKVTINSYHIDKDYDGAPCIAIDYTFTNVSDDDATSMQLATNITVYQDGVECEDAFFADSNSDGYSNKVKAGVSVDVTRAYKLQNTTSDVEVEVAPLFSWTDELLAYEVLKIS